MSIQVMKQALEALEGFYEYGYDRRECYEHITAIKEAIAELESQEPVAKVVLTETLELPCLQWLDLNRQFDFKGGEYLYTHPPQRKPLTDEDVWKTLDDTDCTRPMLIARAIEAAHGIKE